MAKSYPAPRINNNDDFVRLVSVSGSIGDQVREGDEVVVVETDKAAYPVHAEEDGFLLAVAGDIGDEIAVGSVLFWLGDSPDDPFSEAAAAADTHVEGGGEPTLKAKLLLTRHGLEASDVPFEGDRLTVADVERFVKSGPSSAGGRAPVDEVSLAPGRRVRMSPEERGMLRTVLWHRDEAAPGYVELPFDPAPWDAYAADFQERHKLLLNPLFGLMSFQLARLAGEREALNSTMVGHEKHVYEGVNLGFTVQSGETLYLAVIANADQLEELDFVNRLSSLQRRATKNQLTPEEMTGYTISFTSMARWNVSRHIPVLPPYTSVIVAHSAPVNGVAVLGATYDHRLFTGFHAAQLLGALVAPPVSRSDP